MRIRSSVHAALEMLMPATIKDILAMHYLRPLTETYLPWSVASMRPSALVVILNDILLNNRQTVVECGGGISTYYMGRILQQRGGHLFTLEHDRSWCDELSDLLHAHQLLDTVSVVHAPLAPVPDHLSVGCPYWYDVEILTGKLASRTIDMLVVDGPPALGKSNRLSRFPAVPFFHNQFNSNFSVVLDDIHRAGEDEILALWEDLLGTAFERRYSNGNIAIAQPSSHYAV